MWFNEGILANNPLADIQLFWSGTASWQVWRKPLGKSQAFMLCIGSGSAGGSPSNSSAVGGGGGGSGAISKLYIPFFMLPDALFVQVGVGGIATAAANGGNGALSFISLQPNSTAANCFLSSGNVAAQGGKGAGTATGGVAGTIATSANCILSTGGTTSFVAGVAGGNGGSTGVGSSVTALVSIPLTGGAGGGGGANAGGNITAAGLLPLISGGTGGASPTAGLSGIRLLGPNNGFMACGGSGGGGTATAATTAANGGMGEIGSGGGGGGSSSSSTSAIGGRGGDGFVAIVSV